MVQIHASRWMICCKCAIVAYVSRYATFYTNLCRNVNHHASKFNKNADLLDILILRGLSLYATSDLYLLPCPADVRCLTYAVGLLPFGQWLHFRPVRADIGFSLQAHR